MKSHTCTIWSNFLFLHFSCSPTWPDPIFSSSLTSLLPFLIFSSWLLSLLPFLYWMYFMICPLTICFSSFEKLSYNWLCTKKSYFPRNLWAWRLFLLVFSFFSFFLKISWVTMNYVLVVVWYSVLDRYEFGSPPFNSKAYSNSWNSSKIAALCLYNFLKLHLSLEGACTCHSAHMDVRRQLVGSLALSSPYESGVELRSWGIGQVPSPSDHLQPFRILLLATLILNDFSPN